MSRQGSDHGSADKLPTNAAAWRRTQRGREAATRTTCAGPGCMYGARGNPTKWIFRGYDGSDSLVCDECAQFIKGLYGDSGLTPIVRPKD